MEQIISVSPDLAFAIELMRHHLRADYGYDFSFVVLAGGALVAANNAADGIIIAQATEVAP